MGPLTHIVLFAAYALGAAAVAFGLPDAVAEISQNLGYALGGCIFLAAALLHEAIARRLSHAELRESVREARRLTLDLERDIDNIREDIARLGGTGAGVIAGNGGDNKNEFVLEMRVLQSLLKNLERSGGRPTAAASAATTTLAEGGDGAAAPAAASAAPATQSREARPAARPYKPRPVLTGLSNSEILDITRSALQNNRVDLYLQPIVDLPQRQVRFYEAFSRIRNENGDLILPEQYIPLAAEAGLVSTIDNLLLFRCVQLVRRFERSNNDAGFFCNISSHSLYDTDFFPQFLEFMQHNRRLASRLIFELSEADLRTPGIREPLSRLSALGFGLSIDRVSDLEADFPDLAARNVRYIKVGLPTLFAEPKRRGARTRGGDQVVRIKASNIEVIAEKVEDEKNVVDLLDFDIGYAQGFLFASPGRAGNQRPERNAGSPRFSPVSATGLSPHCTV